MEVHWYEIKANKNLNESDLTKVIRNKISGDVVYFHYHHDMEGITPENVVSHREFYCVSESKKIKCGYSGGLNFFNCKYV